MGAGFSGLGTMAPNLRKAGFAPVDRDVRPDAAKPQLAAWTWAANVQTLSQALLQKYG